MPIDDGVVIAEKVGGQRPIRALDAHVIEQIAVLAGGEGTVGKGDPDLFPLAVLLEMIFQGQEMGGPGRGRPLGEGRASGENYGSPPFILAYLRKAGRYRRTACIPSWKFQRIRGHRGQRTSKRPLDA